VIASLNGSTTGGWTSYATALERAGAAAIELNIYHLPGDPLFPGRDVEQRHVQILTTDGCVWIRSGAPDVVNVELRLQGETVTMTLEQHLTPPRTTPTGGR